MKQNNTNKITWHFRAISTDDHILYAEIEWIFMELPK